MPGSNRIRVVRLLAVIVPRNPRKTNRGRAAAGCEMLIRIAARLALFALLGASVAVAAQPASFDDQFRRGLVALQNNDLTVAKQSLEQAARLQPENPKVWAALAQAYLRSKQTDPANAAAKRAEALAADDPVVQHALAIFFSETGDFARAAGLERRFASSKAADPQAAARAATLSLEAGEPQQAIIWAKAALGQRDSVDMHHLLGKAEEAANQPEAALAEFRRAVELAPWDEGFTFDLGQALLHRGDFAGALAFFEAARERYSKSAQIELAYGVAAYGQRRFRDAIAAFLHVTHLDPTIEQPYIFIGKILENAGDLMPEVLSRYAAWGAAQPDNYLPWFLHAKALDASSGDPVRSEAELRRSIRLNPNFWESHLELGIILIQRQQWQEAASELSRAIELDGKRPTPHFQLARVYNRLGKREQAQAELAEFKRLSASETESPVP
jgi:Flp pilus assembly protein TadD